MLSIYNIIQALCWEGGHTDKVANKPAQQTSPFCFVGFCFFNVTSVKFWVLLATLLHRFTGFHEPLDKVLAYSSKHSYKHAPKKTLKKCFLVSSEEVSSLGT